ncbi:MAG: beta-ketoacyl-[acyl-carrier-protein] synthase family protein [Desulfobacterium sp.]|nr:beta-ketoacyl-[acyl-carrier-protein] synthase family protein [Desulfobacterium sp.]MBU3950185.1 beta-ketoacyl-[acyl-carrier-protein] synthase family protein [Pseudomonadota bacterium]MBU4037668.1 beta-ketoacyl-[acyl-carrier-protein] synthase family protein [Pseudomonadota bacterium]
MIKVVSVAADMVTSYGWGTDVCWEGLFSGKTAIRPIERFPTHNLQTGNAATVPGLTMKPDESLVMQMLRPLLDKSSIEIPYDTFIILATTNGDIEFVQRFVLDEENNPEKSLPDCLLDKIMLLTGTFGKGMVVSSACASSSIAVSRAASLIRNKVYDCILVIGCDCVSEFVTAGFSSLMALDPDVAKPFDKNRQGLSLGEAAGYMLLMSEERAAKGNTAVMGEVAGWGLTNDANHITGPSRDGSGLYQAIYTALKSAGIAENKIGSISAHGTGTVYNDSMEMKAIRSVFAENTLPVYSVKGGIGHTLGAAGLLEIIISFKSLDKKITPPTVNLFDIDEEAEGWVFPYPQTFESSYTLSTNSGFGGVNSALILKI